MDLLQNPFYILSASTRDDNRRILELAEEKSLTIDPDVCAKARSDLITPRNRLAAEIAWLPGIAPGRVIDLTRMALGNPVSVTKQPNVPPLASANLVVAAIARLAGPWKAENLAESFNLLAQLYEEIDAEVAMRDINEDREIAGFPSIKSVDTVQNELNERRKHYVGIFRATLDRLPTDLLVETVTQTVEMATLNGETHAPILIEDLVDRYEVEVQHFLEKEGENVREIVRHIEETATTAKEEGDILCIINELDSMVRNWDRVAQPIQLSTKSRGLDHEPSHELAYAIRGVAIDVCNKYGFLESARRITHVLCEVFEEVPEVLDRLEGDAEAIESIFENREEAKKNDEKWAEEISFEENLGVVFKKRLWISPESVGFKTKGFPLEEVTRVRWGAVRTQHRANFVPVGTSINYTICFGDNRKLVRVDTSKEWVFTKFTDKLWRAVCVGLLTEMLGGMAEGKKYPFGGFLVDDGGMELAPHIADPRIYAKWSEIAIATGPGYFHITLHRDSNFEAKLSYLEVDNVHILEAAIRMFWKQPGGTRLSSLLKG